MDIEELFKKRLENDTEEVSADLWQRLEAKMEASASPDAQNSAHSANKATSISKGISTLGKSLIAIASAAGLFTGVYLLVSDDKTPQQLVQTPVETPATLLQEEPIDAPEKQAPLAKEQGSKTVSPSADTLKVEATDAAAQAPITEPVSPAPPAIQAPAKTKSEDSQSKAGTSEQKPSVEKTAQNTQSTKAAPKPVEALPEIKIRIPNVITPNNDGVNDFFAIFNLENYPDNELIIFDRNNKVIFNVRGYQNNWDAQGVPQGVYFYNLAVKQGSNCKIFKGSINVIR
ncbi:MAG: gliding motility-associated C-terminal domain-containing protein [Candidatus Onthomorpha sp.]